ncbi:MAG: radical SAM protein [Thermodesulfobacteriota bacterium]
MRKTVINSFAHLISRGNGPWRPLLSVYYLTYSCKFRCPYCADGNGRPFYSLADKAIPAPEALRVLGAIRRHCDFVVLTGGEPFQHPEADAVLAGISALGFAGVTVTTNGHGIIPHLPVLAASVDDLVVSLDTLDAQKADSWFGVGPGALDNILEGLQAAARIKNARYKITISSVATPENIEDLYEVHAFCKARGFALAVCPQLRGVKAHADLLGNPGYRRFYDFLIREKKQGGNIFGSPGYLASMRDFAPFRCRPFTMLTVAPDGSVFYPCLERGNNAGNILSVQSLGELKRNGHRLHGPPPRCENQCHSACALSFALIFNKPWTVLPELACRARPALKVRRAKETVGKAIEAP